MLKYIGKGDFLPGVPARDLSEAEVTEHGAKRLLKSGLYARPKPARKPANEKEGE